jgi:hypothetical protein
LSAFNVSFVWLGVLRSVYWRKLQAIKASDGTDFLGNGRVVQSTFFNADKFEEGIYE